MSLLISTNMAKSPQKIASDANIIRRTSEYHPSIWGDHFLSYATNSTVMDDNTEQRVRKMKEEVKKMLTAASDQPSQKIHLIDAIQRLGVSYHFEPEIGQVLHQIHKIYNQNNDKECHDLYTVSLNFRLLRQQGYYVPCDVFNKFKDDNGEFKESLVGDVRGMLSLYEATHLRVRGEDVLEEALAFTTIKLASLESQLSPSLAAQVSHALKQPLHKNIPKLEARHYISIYQQDPSHNQVLLPFAKLDFNVLQGVHQKELSEFTRWWNDIDFKHKLPFARDRVVECYFWILSVYPEPEYVLSRKILTKVIALTSTIDDIYDNYGTFEELELFTQAIERWEIAALDQLPNYMKVCYAAVLDAYSEFEEEMAREGKSYCVYYAKEAMKIIVRAYFQEVKWFDQQYTPTIEEYMSNALITSGYPLLTTISFTRMGDIVTEATLDWLFTMPTMLKASAIMTRLMDDIVSNKFEQERGHVASSVECYMIQHGVTEEEVMKEFKKQVSDAWKDMNNECLQPTVVPLVLLKRILNFGRVMDVMYKDGDGYTHPQLFLKDFVASLLVDPVPA